MMQSFVSLGWTTVLWFTFGYSDELRPDLARHHRQLRRRTRSCVALRCIRCPHRQRCRRFRCVVHIAYQMMFAIITPALITGAFTNRVTFKAVHLVPHRLAAVRLLPVRAHDLGRRVLQQWGVSRLRRRHRGARDRRDCRACVGALRRRRQSSRTGRTTCRSSRWAPACSGSAGTGSTPAANCSVDGVTAHRHSSTRTSRHRSPPSRGCSWSGRADAKPKFVGLLTGAVAGLATITPAAGYVSLEDRRDHRHRRPALVCYGAVTLKNRAAAGTTRSTSGACTASGDSSASCCSASSRSTLWNPNGADGLLAATRVSRQAVRRRRRVQRLGVDFTYAMLWLINFVTPVKVDEVAEQHGLDIRLHGEEAIRSASDQSAKPQRRPKSPRRCRRATPPAESRKSSRARTLRRRRG